MPRRTSTELTSHQREVLDWIKEFVHDHGMPPTVREIGNAFDIKSSSAFDLLKALERKGCLERGNLGARSLIVKGSGHVPCTCEAVPIIGRIAAGKPTLAVEDYSGSVMVEKDLLRGHEAYALRVEGDSMIEAGIFDGDCVVIRKQDTADDGDVVVALIEDEATLKRFHREQNRIRLDPANKRMEPIYVDSGEFRVQGKVVAIHRTL